MKLLVFALSFAVLMGLASSANMMWGAIGNYDTLLHYEIVKKSSSLFSINTIDVEYPAPDHYSNRTITAIRVTDQVPNDKGGYAQLSAGGIGFTHATIHLKSQRGKSLNFIIEFYGRK